MNKDFLNKLNLLLIIMCILFIFIPNTVTAATNVTQMVHKTNVPASKVWNIKFNQGINEDKLSNGVKIYNPNGKLVIQKKISYDHINNTIIVEPPNGGYYYGQTYSLHINNTVIRGLNSNQLKAPVIMNFTIEAPDKRPINSSDKQYNYKKYDKTLKEIVDMQSKVGAVVGVVPNYSLKASDIDIYEYLNPKNFENHEDAVYQFLTLNYIEGISVEDLNVFLKGNGVLENQGAAFLKAAKEKNINVAYLTAHTILETGHGTSKLSTGYPVSEVGGKAVPSRKTYNMFGIGATDGNPLKNGSEKAYTEGWFSVESAIMGGAKYVSTNYINNSNRKQNTLYKMRWNPQSPATYQYATDIGWAYKISTIMKPIQDKCKNGYLVFEIPQYK